jgi:predicted Fe-Mo cluster-binding NifX family protein
VLLDTDLHLSCQANWSSWLLLLLYYLVFSSLFLSFMFPDIEHPSSRSSHSFRLAMPVWEGRISPVFDSAEQLWVLEIKSGAINLVEKISLYGTERLQLGSQLKRLEVKAIICGAISHPLAHLLETSGMRVYSFKRGEVEKVVDAFLMGNLEHPENQMAGKPIKSDSPSSPNLGGPDPSSLRLQHTGPRSH